MTKVLVYGNPDVGEQIIDASVPQQYGEEIIGQLGAEHPLLDGLGHWWMIEDRAAAARG